MVHLLRFALNRPARYNNLALMLLKPDVQALLRLVRNRLAGKVCLSQGRLDLIHFILIKIGIFTGVNTKDSKFQISLFVLHLHRVPVGLLLKL